MWGQFDPKSEREILTDLLEEAHGGRSPFARDVYIAKSSVCALSCRVGWLSAKDVTEEVPSSLGCVAAPWESSCAKVDFAVGDYLWPTDAKYLSKMLGLNSIEFLPMHFGETGTPYVIEGHWLDMCAIQPHFSWHSQYRAFEEWVKHSVRSVGCVTSGREVLDASLATAKGLCLLPSRVSESGDMHPCGFGRVHA